MNKNSLKRKVLIFGYKVDDTTSPRPSTVTDLAVISDQKLLFVSLIDSVEAAASKAHGFIVCNRTELHLIST